MAAVAQYQNSTFDGGEVNNQEERYYLVGLNLEYRFNPHLAVKAGTDPPTAALYCGRSNLSLGTVIQTPRQWGLSLVHNWHF